VLALLEISLDGNGEKIIRVGFHSAIHNRLASLERVHRSLFSN
jgi:hypothetical protein